MALEPEQIEDLREILGIGSYDQAEALAANLKPVQVTATTADIALWKKVRDKHTRLEGGKAGVFIDKGDNRLAIRNRVRLRCGLLSVASLDEIEISGTFSYSHPAQNQCDVLIDDEYTGILRR